MNMRKTIKLLIFFIKGIFPPFILLVIKKIVGIKQSNTFYNFLNTANYKPIWNTLNYWPFNNNKILINPGGPFSKMITGEYDKELFGVLKTENLKNKTVFDIGAHIGFDTLAFANLVGENGMVIAFEPNIYNVERLKMNIESNLQLKNRIVISNCALSDKDGQEEFIFSDNIESGTSSGSFIESADTAWEKGVYEDNIGFKRVKVETLSLDGLIDQYKNNEIAMLKIDVEGAENLILKGAENFLKKFRPVILLEVHSILNGLLVAKYLGEYGYKINILSSEADGRCFICAKSLIQAYEN